MFASLSGLSFLSSQPFNTLKLYVRIKHSNFTYDLTVLRFINENILQVRPPPALQVFLVHQNLPINQNHTKNTRLN